MFAFPELTGNRFCTKKAIGLAPAGGLSVFCLHSGAVFKIVFRGRKICALYFKICLTYFEICRTYFLFAPTWGLSAENQFSFFASKYPLFLACLFVPGISVSMRRTRTLRQFIQQPQKGAKPNEIKTLPLLTNGPAGLAKN